MKMLVGLLMIILFGTTTITAKVPEEIKKGYKIEQSKNQVMAVFKYTLDKKDEDSGKVSAIMIRGLDITAELAEEGKIIGCGVLFNDDSMVLYLVEFNNYQKMRRKEITPQEFMDRVKIKRVKDYKGK